MLINAYATHRSPPDLSFPHRLRSRRDRSDPELAEHLLGFSGFVTARGERPMTPTRYHVLAHLERVRHQVALEVKEAHMDQLAGWAEEANAILYLPDGTVRAPSGAILVAPDTGDPQRGAAVPYPASAVRRKHATEAKLESLGVRAAKSLPPVVAEVEVELRAPADVASRCLALFACASRADARGRNERPADVARSMPLAFAALSPKERAFVAAKTPDEQDVVSFTWRYEALAALLWAVRPGEELPPLGDGGCDVPALAAAMAGQSEADFVASARLRPVGEILDALDLCFRLHWALTEARVNDGPEVKGVEGGAVLERHYALNWLTRFQEADWDEVETPT